MATSLQRNENLAAVETLNKPIDWKKVLGSILGGMTVALVLIYVLIICGDTGKRRRKRGRQKDEKTSELLTLSDSNIAWSESSGFASVDKKKRKKKKKRKRRKRRKHKIENYLADETDQEGWNWKMKGLENEEEAEPKEEEEEEAEDEDEAKAEAKEAAEKEVQEEAEEEDEEEDAEAIKKKKKNAKQPKGKKDSLKSGIPKSKIVSSINALIKEILLQLVPANREYGNKFPMLQALNKQPVPAPDKEITAPQTVLPPVSPQQQFLQTPLVISPNQQQFRQPKLTPRLALQLAPQLSPLPPLPPLPPPHKDFQSPMTRERENYQLKTKSPILYQRKIPTPVAPPIPLKQYEMRDRPSRKTRKTTFALGKLSQSSILQDNKLEESKMTSYSSSKKTLPFYARWKPGGSSIYGPDTGVVSDSSSIMAKMVKSQSLQYSSISSSGSEMNDRPQKFFRKFKNV